MCENCNVEKGIKNELVRQMNAINIGGVEVGGFSLVMFMHRRDSGWTLDSEVIMGNGVSVDGTSTDIKYCPFCGKVLE